MRILFLNHTGTVSGAERALLHLVGAIRGQHDVTVACPAAGDLVAGVAELSVAHRAVPTCDVSFRPHWLGTPLGMGRLGAGSVALTHLVYRGAPGVIYANTTRAALMAMLCRRLMRVPLVVRLHDHLPESRAGYAVRDLIAAHADAVLAVSEYTAARFNRGLREPIATCVYNGIDHARFALANVPSVPLRDQFAISPNAVLLGHVAQITPWKAQADSIRINFELGRLGVDAHLFVIGGIAFSGSRVRYDNHAYLRHLHDLVRELDLGKRVHFLGNRGDVPGLLRALDLTLLPSREEPGALSVIESLAMGTPAFVSARSGTAEFIQDGVSGRALPDDAPQLWAEAITDAVTARTDLATMRTAARTAATRFSLQRHAQETIAHLKAAARAPSTRHPELQSL